MSIKSNMAFYTTNVLLMIILFLAVILLSMVLYGCKYPSIEKFEDKVMTEGGAEDTGKSIMEAALKSNDPQVKELISKLQKSPAATAVPPAKEDMPLAAAEPVTEETAAKPKLEGKDQELFKAIVGGEISNADLEKLAKAGILTEATIDKFLGQMEGEGDGEKKSTTIEGFSCGMDYATF